MATLIVEIDDALDQVLTSEAMRNGLSKADHVRQRLRADLLVQQAIAAPETAAEWLSQLRERFASIGYAEDLVAQIPPRHELPRSADFRSLDDLSGHQCHFRVGSPGSRCAGVALDCKTATI